MPGFPGIVAGVFIVVALSEELDDRKAALPARNGNSAVAGLAVYIVSFERTGRFGVAINAPRRAIEAADLVVDNMLATNRKEKARPEEWRVKTRGGGRAVRDEVHGVKHVWCLGIASIS